MNKREGTSKSGYCMAGPPGSRPPHHLCTSARCTCECHEDYPVLTPTPTEEGQP